MAARARWPMVRAVGGALLLAAIVWSVGPGTVVDALAAVDMRTVVVAVMCTLVATVAAAWRWTLLARRAGLDLELGDAVRAYYRSQLLNATLPLGVIGDVERAVRHGRSASRRGLAGRTVVADRVLGQIVALLLTGALLGVAPTLLPSWLAPAGGWLAAGCLLALLGLLARRPQVVLASVVVAGAHGATLVVAARSVGAQASVATLAPLALVVLAGGALPVNLAGWGPREGVAAWAFAAAGLGAGVGVAAAVVHGMVTLVAVSPGLAFLGRGGASGRHTSASPVHSSSAVTVHAAATAELCATSPTWAGGGR